MNMVVDKNLITNILYAITSTNLCLPYELFWVSRILSRSSSVVLNFQLDVITSHGFIQ
jgi:hypothetical protein